MYIYACVCVCVCVWRGVRAWIRVRAYDMQMIRKSNSSESCFSKRICH